jgi:hypothetical protein
MGGMHRVSGSGDPRLGTAHCYRNPDSRLHFGLGGHDRAEFVGVSWQSGHTDHFRDLKADAAYFLREGQSVPQPLVGSGAAGLRGGPE